MSLTYILTLLSELCLYLWPSSLHLQHLGWCDCWLEPVLLRVVNFSNQNPPMTSQILKYELAYPDSGPLIVCYFFLSLITLPDTSIHSALRILCETFWMKTFRELYFQVFPKNRREWREGVDDAGLTTDGK